MTPKKEHVHLARSRFLLHIKYHTFEMYKCKNHIDNVSYIPNIPYIQHAIPTIRNVQKYKSKFVSVIQHTHHVFIDIILKNATRKKKIVMHISCISYALTFDIYLQVSIYRQIHET